MRWRISRRHRDEDFDRELRGHLELEAEERKAAGATADEARLAAQRAFGNIAIVKEDTRAMWGRTSVEQLWRDGHYATRILARRPAFAAVAVLSLAVALGANTAVFSFARAIVLKSLPVRDAARLVILRQHNETFRIENCCFPYPFFRELRKQDAGFEDVLAVKTIEANLTEGDRTDRLQVEIVSGNYFAMLGVRAAAGRLLLESDDQAEGAGRVCVVSHRLWQERFGGRPETVGARILLNGEPFLIAGVSEPGFSGAALHEPHDIQVPSSMAALLLGDGRGVLGWAELVARLKPGVEMQQAEARLNSVGRQVQKVTGPKMSERDDFLLRDGSQGIGSKKEQFGKPVLLLLLLVAVVLLVACANLAALLLVRSVERAREAGIRVALGASRPALFRQFLMESLLLAACGGLAGWQLARLLAQALLDLLGPQSEGLLAQVRPDAAIFAFSAAVTVAAGVLFGTLPAWRAARTDPMPAVRGAVPGAGGRWSLSRFIVAGQVAMSLALLFCAGLFSQTLRNLRSIDLGFHPENVALLRVDLSRTAYRDQSVAAFLQDLLRGARELPGTRAASLAGLSVLAGSMQSIVLQVPGYVQPNRTRPVAYFTRISSGYFTTLGMPLLVGRDFLDTERDTGEGAVIVNEQFARTFFAGDAMGKTFSYGGGGRKVRVVGIAGTAKFRWVREDPHPVMYLPMPQNFPQALFLQVRTAGDPSGAIERLRSLLRNLDPRVPADSIMTMRAQIDHTLARERMLAFLSTLLALIAVTLAAIGLYGVLSFSVVRRMREIGIRMAVGAGRRRILALVLSESAAVVLAGVAAGIPLALLSGRLASSLLYGLKPQDTATAILAVALLALVALAATAIPAWRAARVDPMAALRHE